MRYRPITRNKEFARAYARGKAFVHPKLVLYVMKNRLGHTRVGITATKKNRQRRAPKPGAAGHPCRLVPDAAL